MIWYLLWLWWRSNPGVLVEWLKVFSYFWTGACVVCFLALTLIVAYRARQGEIQVTPKPGPADYPDTYDDIPVILHDGSEVWIANGQEERRLTVSRIKPMKDGKGFTLFVGKHSTRKPKTFDSAILSTPQPNPNPVEVLIKPPSPEEPKGDCPL